MSKNLFVGVDEKARKAKEFYVGVNGKARRIVKAYIGDENGKARPFWEKESNIAENSLEFVGDDSFSIKAGKLWDGTIMYNNGNGWIIWDGSEISSNNIHGRQRIYLRGSRNSYIRGNNASYSNAWKIDGYRVECNGNIECLLDYQKVAVGEHPVMSNNCFKYMFANCSALIAAPQLPATTLAKSCYSGMFYKCDRLTTAPELPATTLANDCYSNMFSNCGRLTTATALPATTLAPNCYANMFTSCNKLTTVPALPATTLTMSCYVQMFFGAISISETQSEDYPTPYRIPITGEGTVGSRSLSNMFNITPTINTTYYLPKGISIIS